jgi:hypothetical protein
MNMNTSSTSNPASPKLGKETSMSSPRIPASPKLEEETPMSSSRILLSEYGKETYHKMLREAKKHNAKDERREKKHTEQNEMKISVGLPPQRLPQRPLDVCWHHLNGGSRCKFDHPTKGQRQERSLSYFSTSNGFCKTVPSQLLTARTSAEPSPQSLVPQPQSFETHGWRKAAMRPGFKPKFGVLWADDDDELVPHELPQPQKFVRSFPQQRHYQRICKKDPNCRGFPIPDTQRIVPCKFVRSFPQQRHYQRICKKDPNCRGFPIPGTQRIVPCKFAHPVRDARDARGARGSWL